VSSQLAKEKGNSGRREVWRDIQVEGKNSVQVGVSMTSLEGSSLLSGSSRKTATGHEPG